MYQQMTTPLAFAETRNPKSLDEGTRNELILDDRLRITTEEFLQQRGTISASEQFNAYLDLRSRLIQTGILDPKDFDLEAYWRQVVLPRLVRAPASGVTEFGQ